MTVHFITYEQHQDGDKGEKPEGRNAVRTRARYTQDLEHVIEQAEHDRDVNGRQDVRVEDAKGAVIWPRK